MDVKRAINDSWSHAIFSLGLAKGNLVKKLAIDQKSAGALYQAKTLIFKHKF